MALENERNVNQTRVAIPHDTELDFAGTAPMSFAAWVELPSGYNQQTWATLIAKMDTTWRVSILGGNDYMVHWVKGGGNFDVNLANNDDILHHVVCTTDGVTKFVYFDGVFQDSNVGGSIGSNTNEVWITNNSQQQDRGMKCKVEDMRLYDRTLSPAEIASLFAMRGRDNIRDGLVAQWPFNEGAVGSIVGTTYSTTGRHHGTGGPVSNEPIYAGKRIWNLRPLAG